MLQLLPDTNLIVQNVRIDDIRCYTSETGPFCKGLPAKETMLCAARVSGQNNSEHMYTLSCAIIVIKDNKYSWYTYLVFLCVLCTSRWGGRLSKPFAFMAACRLQVLSGGALFLMSVLLSEWYIIFGNGTQVNTDINPARCSPWYP